MKIDAKSAYEAYQSVRAGFLGELNKDIERTTCEWLELCDLIEKAQSGMSRNSAGFK